MRKYYTRPCNFYYGNYARKLIEEKKALSLTGRSNIAFDQVEVFHRKRKQIVESKFYSIKEIKQLDNEISQTIEKDLKNITLEREGILGLKFDVPLIIGGGINSAKQAKEKCKAGADIIVVGNAIEKDNKLIQKLSDAIHSI